MLGAFVLFTLTLLFNGVSATTLPTNNEDEGDVALYTAIIERIRDGENYHDADGAELRKRGFGVRPVFHWRTPVHLVTMALLPDFVPPLLLLMLCIALCKFSVRGHRPRVQVIGGAALMLILMGIPAAAILAEAWMGVLIAVSAHIFDSHRRTAIGLAILALFFRELTIVYIAVCVLHALWRRDFRELGIWSAGLVAYAAYYGWHISEVLERTLPTDRYEMEWANVGGIKAIITTSRFFGVLILAPAVVASLFLSASLLGTLAKPAPWVLKGSAIAFVLLCYLVAKNPQNGYWGLAYCGLIGPGILWFVPAMRDLVASLKAPST